jgi:predicted acylesterase/phospholipase RssA
MLFPSCILEDNRQCPTLIPQGKPSHMQASLPLSPGTNSEAYKLTHHLEQQQDGKQHWRIWLDVDPHTLEGIEGVTYSAEDIPMPSQPGLQSDRFSALMGSSQTMTVKAAIKLKDLQEQLILFYNIEGQKPEQIDKSVLIRQARAALSGAALTSAELGRLCESLVSIDQFDYASELLIIKIDQDEAAGIKPSLSDCQDLVKYIYKDNSLSSQFKYDRAIKTLNAVDDLTQTRNCESLGLAGAIYKRRWQYDHQYRNLILALHYHERGFKTWQAYIDGNNDLATNNPGNDRGWNAINYAYVLELEAVNRMEETCIATALEGFDSSGLIKAQEIRKYLLQQFLNDPFGTPTLKNPDFSSWVLATIAEAYFGLCRYDQAVTFIRQYRNRQSSKPWKLRSFSQQIFSIANLQQSRQQLLDETRPVLVIPFPKEAEGVDLQKIAKCLNALDIEGDAQLELDNYGKMGLALSGGGFRASLFHIGVLAALAERHELRHIEVISCVSGGSIIGAYYYLKLKLLLESKDDDNITQEDYLQLVREIEEEFLHGVQKNLRMRIFSNLKSNFRMLSKDYSRTNRLGELYEQHLYKPIFEAHVKKLNDRGETEKADRYRQLTGPDARPIYMQDLFITPDKDFVFSTDNWKRKNKVPQLILNATSINTGHNWQFTASWMGEPATDIISDIDVKPRLRRMYYKDAPEPYRQFRLGYAVGASSCVPVMFEPLPLNGLYPGVDLQLIDGGLHDNQGIASIIDQECRNVLISDASGQLATNNAGVSGPLSLFMRADSILQERLRELQFMDMKERRHTTLLSRLHHVHLKNGITTIAVNWKNCTDPPRTISYVDPNVRDKNLMPYGILRSVQQRISEIRTDLDAFHDTEAWSLMYDGYQQMHYTLKQTDPVPLPTMPKWKFIAIQDYLTDPSKAEQIDEKLHVSSMVPFKVYHLLGGKWLGRTLGAVALILTAMLVYNYWAELHGDISISIWSLVVIAALFLLGLVFKPAAVFLNPKSYIRKQVMRVAIAIIGWLSFNTYLGLFNGVYLRKGKLPQKK